MIVGSRNNRGSKLILRKEREILNPWSFVLECDKFHCQRGFACRYDPRLVTKLMAAINYFTRKLRTQLTLHWRLFNQEHLEKRSDIYALCLATCITIIVSPPSLTLCDALFSSSVRGVLCHQWFSSPAAFCSSGFALSAWPSSIEHTSPQLAGTSKTTRHWGTAPGEAVLTLSAPMGAETTFPL